MKRFLTAVAGAALVALPACEEERDPLGPGEPTHQRAVVGEIAIVDWNVYYGADLDVLLDESHPLPVRSALVLDQVMRTNAPARAAAIARAIAARDPHLVSLQEVAHYRYQSPGDFLDAAGSILNPVPNATGELFDFLDLLLDALAAQGADYVVASRTTTLDAELPIVKPDHRCSPCDDLRLTESVAILARSDVVIRRAEQHVFSVNLPVEVSGLTLEIVKGWASVEAEVDGRHYRVVTTHLEPADVLPGHEVHEPIHEIQLAQAAQLLEALQDVSMPVILAGDLNTEPGGTSTGTYALMAESGFVDTWLVGPDRGDGFTANQDADLLNPESKLWHRVDYVLFRDALTSRGLPFRGHVVAEVIGGTPQERTPEGLWPSDHAGISARLFTVEAGVAVAEAR